MTQIVIDTNTYSFLCFNKSQLECFLLVDRVRVANVDPAVAEAYGLVYHQLKQSGAMIPLNDVWIGATAVALKAPLLTYDKHFAKIEGLNLILKEVAQ